jgi:diguanylate cyclase (GGDEF)-like protein
MKGYGGNGKPQRVVSCLEIGLVLILVGSLAGAGFYVHNTLNRVRKDLPEEILGQAGELTILIQELAGLVYAAELAVSEPKAQRRDAIIVHNNAVRGRLAAIRTRYAFDNLIGAAAIHALVNPASEDIQRWLIHGLPGFSPASPTIMGLVETRARDALARTRDLSLQGSTTALTLLNQGAMRLEAFRTGMLIMLALLVLLTLVVIGLFFSRQRATVRLATLRAHLADAIKNIPEGFVLCDAEDRVVVYNEQYQRMYSSLREKIQPGVPFRELAQGFLQTQLVIGVEEGREAEALEERMARHLNPGQPFEHELRDGRRLRISERRTRNGGIVGIHTDMTDVRKVQERLRHLATHDVLTGLPNRAFCQENMERVMARARQRGLGFAILYLDLDRFKIINDTLGHHAGDEVLRAVAKRLKGQLRDEDILARLGGDEFIVILGDFVHFPSAQVLAQRFLRALSEPFQTSGGQEVFVYTSIGVAHFPEDGDNIDTLMRNADAASYRAKSQGPNNYALYTSDFDAKAEQGTGLPRE